MSEYGTAEGPTADSAKDSLSIPFLVLASLLCGVGLFGLSFWLVTSNWLYFASLIPLILGALMLFMRGTGPDHG
ncbi:MAG: hypothetical protein ABSB97_04465 [Thermoplasmata archaeon]|jgi:hypothetical protein